MQGHILAKRLPNIALKSVDLDSGCVLTPTLPPLAAESPGKCMCVRPWCPHLESGDSSASLAGSHVRIK